MSPPSLFLFLSAGNIISPPSSAAHVVDNSIGSRQEWDKGSVVVVVVEVVVVVVVVGAISPSVGARATPMLLPLLHCGR
jgi:hypothetical protein